MTAVMTLQAKPRNISRISPHSTQTFAPPRARDALGKVVSFQQARRPFAPRDIELLRFLFSDLEGYCGLGSNFGHMIEQLAAQVVVTAGVPRSIHQLDGLMHVHAVPPSKRLLDLPVESYACWSNDRAREIGHFRATLERLVEEDRPCRCGEPGCRGRGVEDVVVLARMYGQDERADAPADTGKKTLPDEAPAPKPPHVWLDDFKMLGDVVRIATMSATVSKHVERMTREARESLHRGFFERTLSSRNSREILHYGANVTIDCMRRHAAESNVTIEPLDAMYDLLVVKSGETRERRAIRKAAGETVRREANAALVHAQKSFLRAARHGTQEKGERSARGFAPVDFVRKVAGYRGVSALLTCGHLVDARGPGTRRCRECEER